MTANPYTLVFGKEPANLIERMAISDEISNAFLSDPPSQQIFMITGVRGSGKTVLMTEISKRFGSKDEWIVVELNPTRDMSWELASKLYNTSGITELFKKAKINLSFLGIGVEISNTDSVTDVNVALERLFENLKKHGKRFWLQ